MFVYSSVVLSLQVLELFNIVFVGLTVLGLSWFTRVVIIYSVGSSVELFDCLLSICTSNGSEEELLKYVLSWTNGSVY